MRKLYANITKSCNEYECANSTIKYGVCYPYYPYDKIYQNRILNIYWFYEVEEGYYSRFPSYNAGNSNLLLFQLTSGKFFSRNGFGVGRTNIRK